MQESKSCVLAT